MLKKIQVNIPFVEAIAQMPKYAKFLKDLISNKKKLEEMETVTLTKECSALISDKLPYKRRQPGNLTIPCEIGPMHFQKALCDSGASINLMPLSIFKKLNLEAKTTSMTLQLADRTTKKPVGIVEDVLVKTKKFIFPVDFVILDFAEDEEVPLILGMPFLYTSKALIDVHEGTLTLRIGEEKCVFDIYKASRQPVDDFCMRLDIVDNCVDEVFHAETKIIEYAFPVEECAKDVPAPNPYQKDLPLLLNT